MGYKYLGEKIDGTIKYVKSVRKYFLKTINTANAKRAETRERKPLRR